MTDLKDLNAAYASDLRAKAQFDYIRCKLMRLSIDHLPDSPQHRQIKAAVTVSTQTGLPDYRATSDVIIRLARTLLGQMGISSSEPNTIGFDIPADPQGGFVAEGKPIPASKLALGSARTMVARIATIFGLDDTLVRATEGRAARDFERCLTNVIRRIENRELLGTQAAVAGERPEGLLHNAPDLSEGSPAGLETAVQNLFAYVSDGDPVRPFFICSPRAALYLSLQRHDGGAAFPGVRVTGGDIGGVPLLTSGAAGNKLVLVDAGRLFVVDEGLEVDSSRGAAIQLSDSPTDGPANLVAAFQTNTIYSRLQRWIGWTKAGDDVVAFIEISDLAGSPN